MNYLHLFWGILALIATIALIYLIGSERFALWLTNYAAKREIVSKLTDTIRGIQIDKKRRMRQSYENANMACWVLSGTNNKDLAQKAYDLQASHTDDAKRYEKQYYVLGDMIREIKQDPDILNPEKQQQYWDVIKNYLD